MITIPELVSQALGSFLTSETKGRFGSSHPPLTEVLPFAAKLTLECIGNSDALYHNIEHSMLVTLAGHDILTGRQMLRTTTAGDYANFILACLTHLIGQLGDPHYMKKSNALFAEFEETGLNKTLGYDTPADIVYKYPQFYWKNVAPQIQTAIRYLNLTSSGRQWIANLYSNVFRAEREMNLSGPQL